MDPSAAPAVPLSWEVVTWGLAFFAAAGTTTLAIVGIAQHRREQKRRELEKTPNLLLAVALDAHTGSYRADLANLSPFALWIDGVYANWNSDGDARLELGASDSPPHLQDIAALQRNRTRTVLEPGQWVWLLPQVEGTASTEIVVEFYYAPTGSERHRWAWQIHGEGLAVTATRLAKVPAWFYMQQIIVRTKGG